MRWRFPDRVASLEQRDTDPEATRAAIIADYKNLGVSKLQAYHNKIDADLLVELDGRGSVVPLAINHDLTVASIGGW